MKLTATRPYYGWWIVGGSILCLFASMSVSQAIVGVFMRPVVDDLGWQVWQFTLGSSLAVGAGAMSGVVAGNIVDLKGPRPLILVGASVSGVCLFLLSLQSNLAVFLALYVVAGLIGWNLFGSAVVNATVTKWFVKKRGWALAIGSIGISLAGLITPFVMTTIVDSFGWRTGYRVLAIFVIVAVVPIAFVMRRTPEDYGLKPDGDEGESASNGAAASAVAEERFLTRSEAIRTRGFWLLASGFGLNQAALISVLVHAMPFATDAGFSRSIAATALAVNGFGNLASKVVWGYGLQRVQPRRLVMAAYSVSALGVGLMLVAASNGQVSVLFAGFLLYGFGFGGTIPLSEFLWAKYFGRAHIGAIRGVGLPITIVGSGVGPVLVGYWFDVSLTYHPAFLTIIGAYFIGAVLVSASREPR
jgi:sugar phosphate permease